MRKAKYLGALLIAAAILFRPEDAVAGAQRAMEQWVSSVAPALFPFLALMPVLTGPEACAAYEALFSGIMRPVFQLPGQAAPAVIIGMISGSPGGAMAVRQIAGQSGMRSGEARRLALAVSGVSPAYLIMGVGQGLYGSAKLGMRLAVIQMSVQIILLLLLRVVYSGDGEPVPAPGAASMGNPIRNAVENVLAVCGYMVFFSAVAAVFSSLLGACMGKVLLLAVDLPSGLAELAAPVRPVEHFILGACIGFGGLCIGMQNMDVLREIGLGMGEYIAARCMGASLMGGACMLFAGRGTTAAPKGMQSPMNAYALSVLCAFVLVIPALISFSKKYFLNKGKRTAEREEMAGNTNM